MSGPNLLSRREHIYVMLRETYYRLGAIYKIHGFQIFYIFRLAFRNKSYRIETEID